MDVDDSKQPEPYHVSSIRFQCVPWEEYCTLLYCLLVDTRMGGKARRVGDRTWERKGLDRGTAEALHHIMAPAHGLGDDIALVRQNTNYGSASIKSATSCS